MVVQALLESFSRCFGAPVGPTRSNYESNRNKHIVDGDNESRVHVEGDNEVADTRRRTGRAKGLELQDEEWDDLFSRDSGQPVGCPQNDSRGNNNTTNNSVASKKSLNKEITYPEAYARFKETARSRSSSSKRRREKKNDIFRERRNAPNSSLASRLLGKDGVKALCFANPVHTEGVEIVDDEASACHTLDTADDTTISNMYMDNQYSSNEPRPPMPLFNYFKVNCTGDSKDSLMTIVSTGSHHSARVRHLFIEESHHHIKSTTNNDIKFSPVKQNSYKETIECTGTSRINHGSNSNLCKLESREMLKRPPKSSGDDFPPPVQKISGSNSTSMSSSFI